MATYNSGVEGVEALVPEVGTLSESSNPPLEQVEGWQAAAYSKINRAIGSGGYSMPVTDITAAIYAELTGLENLYAAAYALRARGIDTASGETEARSELWLKDFYSQLTDLAASDLTLVGVSLLPSSTGTRRRRIRTLQMRKVDGYSAPCLTRWEVAQGEYTGPTVPTE